MVLANDGLLSDLNAYLDEGHFSVERATVGVRNLQITLEEMQRSKFLSQPTFWIIEVGSDVSVPKLHKLCGQDLGFCR